MEQCPEHPPKGNGSGLTEKQKLAAGLLYNPALDPQLQSELLRAKQLCFTYNQTAPIDKEQRHSLLRQLLGKLGKEPVIEQPFYCDYGYNIEIGDYFYSNVNLVILDPGKVRIGDHVYIGPNVGFYTAGHPLDKDLRNSGQEYGYPITIGSHVWIGAQVAVMPGVTIGEGAVIGAGSVVTKDIPAYVVAVGNPCRVLREITQEDKQAFTTR
ncbi:maltose O-acetyltransferase [Arachidicoccus rhizosphaerae]|uniref:Acetyltransferase n=1 Tax=Arachidicoccus rhizosphaerae TaxID=551991 RepID=A0A1H4BXJ7_9BACT|nr:sugar O-acetyltransferase [Arachidicoccus rhizosphaerae]SEA52562.1 maltose O-acetyltransferase [Arachidicoccus rhizosphaerae]